MKVILWIENKIGSIIISFTIFAIFFLLVDSTAPYWLTKLKTKHSNKFPKNVYQEPYPYFHIKGTKDSKVQKDNGLNSLGYRGIIPLLPKNKSEIRIAMLGGSTVLMGSPSIAELLNDTFEELNRKNIKVYNFGVAASTLRMDLSRFVFEIEQYDPDIVMFYGAGNDIGMPFQADPRPGYPPNFLAYENNPLLLAGMSGQSLGTLFKLSLFHSHIINALKGEQLKTSLVSLDSVRTEYKWGSEEWSQKIAKAYLDDVRRAVSISKGFKTIPYFIFQPILEFKKNMSSAEQKLHIPKLQKHAALCRSIISSSLSKLSRSSKIEYTDLTSIFDDIDQQVFLDGIHLKQQFQPLIANAIFDSLEFKSLLLKAKNEKN